MIFRRTLTLGRVAALGLLAHCLGCGGEPAENLPPPGSMQVISVTPVPVREEPNLIQNGDFSVWWAGAPANEGFGAPNPVQSVVRREWDGRQWLARQTWSRFDSPEPAVRLFRVAVTGLQPNSWYRLMVNTVGKVDAAISVSVYTQLQDIVTDMPPPLITLLPTRNAHLVNHYSADFQAGSEGEHYVASSLNTPTGGGTEVTWQSWSLYRIEGPDS